MMRLRVLRWSVLLGLVVLLLPACSNGTDDASETTLPFTSGAAGIGDSFYPGLGNGGYDVEHYSIDLVYHTDGTIEADVDIDAIATQNLSGFNLDFVGWEIEQLTVDGDIGDVGDGRVNRTIRIIRRQTGTGNIRENGNR